MGGLDPAKILMVLIVAMIVLGPERLPKMARQLGSGLRDLTRLRERIEEEVRTAIPDLDIPKIPVMPRGGLTGYLTGMMTSVGTSGNAGKARGKMTRQVVTGSAAGKGARGRTEASHPAVEWASTGTVASPARVSSASLSSSGLPAGWQVMGAPSPGFASGSLLSGVPSSAPTGPFAAEIEFSPDEPNWN